MDVHNRDLSKRHPFNGVGLLNYISKMAVVLASDDAIQMTGLYASLMEDMLLACPFLSSSEYCVLQYHLAKIITYGH